MATATGRLAELVAANCPVFHLHPQDKFMPTTVEHFMHHSELQQLQTPSACEAAPEWVTVLQRKQVNSAALAAAQRRFKGRGPMRLNLSDAAHCGYPQHLIDEVPLYVNAKEVLNSSGRVEALELNYLTLYAYNGHYNVFGMAIGAHTGDWEHVTVRLDAATGRTLGMYYHAHRNHDGVWLPAEAMPRDSAGSGRPVAYVAFHGHGCYPSPGRQLRAVLVANDLCSAAGPVWRPRRCVLLPHLAGRPHPPPYAPEWQLGNRVIMRVPSRGTSLPIFADSSLPSLKSDSSSEQQSGTGGCSAIDPISNLSADMTADSTAAPSAQRARGTPQLLDPWKSPTACANRLSAVANITSSKRPPAPEHSMQLVDGKATSLDKGSGCGEAKCEVHRANVASLPEGGRTPSHGDVASVLVGFASARGGSTEGTHSQSSLDLGKLGGVGEQLVDVMQSLQLGGDGGAGVEVVEDYAEWLFFEGHWGNTPAPIVQKWFLCAEPPVSRSLLRRILHFPAEQALPRQR